MYTKYMLYIMPIVLIISDDKEIILSSFQSTTASASGLAETIWSRPHVVVPFYQLIIFLAFFFFFMNRPKFTKLEISGKYGPMQFLAIR